MDNPTYDSLKKGLARVQHQRDLARAEVAHLTEQNHALQVQVKKASQVIGALRQALAHANEEIPDRYDTREWEARKHDILMASRSVTGEWGT